MGSRLHGIGPISWPHVFQEQTGEGSGGSAAPAAPPAAPPAATGPTVEQLAEQLRGVAKERDELKKARDDRERVESERKGEHEKIAGQEREKREAAEAKIVGLGRRIAFQNAAAGKVSDVSAALKLAQADGLLDGIKLTSEGEPEDPKVVDEAVSKVLKAYVFLQPGTRSFGGSNSGRDEAPALDPDRMSPQAKIAAGLRRK